MKRFKVMLLAVMLGLFFTGCAIKQDSYWNEAGEEEVSYRLLPLYDGALAASFLRETSEEEVVNLTTEQADKLFNHIEVFGANLTLPMKVSDLPEGFEITVDQDSFYNIDGSLYLSLGLNQLWYSDGEETVRVANVEILTEGKSDEDIENGYIVFLQLAILDAVDVKVDCIGTGEFFNEELTRSFGEGAFRRHEGKYLIRTYSDGERKLEIQYVGVLAEGDEDKAAEKRKIDIEKTINEATPLIIELSAFPDIQKTYYLETASTGPEGE